jgi:virulence-associated protein VagC
VIYHWYLPLVSTIGIYHPCKTIMAATAKLFMHGRSQAVRLPKEFRFDGSEVRISKVGDKVILEPVKRSPIDLDILGRARRTWRKRLPARRHPGRAAR